MDAQSESIDVFFDSIPRFEQEKAQKAEKLGRSIERVNKEYGTDWDSVLYIQPEEAVHSQPEENIGPGVWYTDATAESLKDSQEFADLSRGLFGGWLEISPEELVEL